MALVISIHETVENFTDKMNIFTRNTTKRHLKQFEIEIAELLSSEFPEFKKVIEMSEINGINFIEKPQGINLTRCYNPKVYEEIKRNHNTCFNLVGVSVLEKKTKKYTPIKLGYLHDALNVIEIESPKQFHRIYDLNNTKIGRIEIKHIKLENPEKAIVLKILNEIENEKLRFLDLENTFEIQIDKQLFFTIIDMEDGNYIAIDKEKKIYLLNHDQKIKVKKIAENPAEFFKIYNGQKLELENIISE